MKIFEKIHEARDYNFVWVGRVLFNWTRIHPRDWRLEATFFADNYETSLWELSLHWTDWRKRNGKN